MLAAREAAGFVTPIEPIEAGRPWCIFSQRGTMELMAHPTDAEHYLRHGIVVDGKLLKATKLAEWPMIGAYQLVCADPDANKEWIK